MKLFEEEQQTNVLSESTQNLIMAMASMGCSKDLLAILLQLGNNPLSKDQQRFLQGPIIQHKSAWQETTPKRLYEAIPQERLKILFNEIKSGKPSRTVGPIELMTVIYPATCDAPMRHELAQIYLRAGAKAFFFKHGKAVEDFWEMVGSSAINDNEVLKPEGQYHYEYRNLCVEIRRKVVRAQKEREGSKKPRNIFTATNSTEIVSTQLSLW